MVFIAILSCLLILAYLICILVFDYGWRNIPDHMVTHRSQNDQELSITVVIPARNEVSNIITCLSSLRSQTYSSEKFEVIIIEDHSTDGTWDAITSFDKGDLRINAMKLENLLPGTSNVRSYKKKGIEVAINASHGDIIVTTDADCIFPAKWLETIAHGFTQSGAMCIAAPVKMPSTASVLSIFQSLDFITLQGITGAAVSRQWFSMGNGANLAYSKKAFLEVGGFDGIDNIASGDDMLLMHKITTRYPGKTLFLKNSNAVVSTVAETSLEGFIRQRMRWSGKADKYDDKRIFPILLLVYLSNLMFLVLAALSLFFSGFLILLLVLLTLKTLVEYRFTANVSAFFGQQKLMRYFPLLQPLHIIYTVTIGLLGKFGTSRWKDRVIN